MTAIVEDQLAACVRRFCAGATGVGRVAPLSGGASQETFAFTILHPDGDRDAILRRAPPGYGAASERAAGLEAEAALMQLAFDAQVPSPRVLHVLTPADDLGTGFIMAKVEGETIPRKILRDAQFDAVRPQLARQLGEILAGIHAIDRGDAAAVAHDEFDQRDRAARRKNIAASAGRGRCSNWRCAGSPTTIQGLRSSSRWCMAISATAI